MSTHGIAIHTIGVVLMLVGILGVALWLVVWLPWARNRRGAYRGEVTPDEVPPNRPYPPGRRYEDDYRR